MVPNPLCPLHNMILIRAAGSYASRVVPAEREPVLSADEELVEPPHPLLFPNSIGRQNVETVHHAIRRMLLEEEGKKADLDRETTAFSQGFVHGRFVLNPKGHDVLTPRWKFSYVVEGRSRVACEFGAIHDLPALFGTKYVQPLYLVNDALGRAMEALIEQGIERQREFGWDSFPFLLCMAAAFRAGLVARMETERKTAAPVVARQAVLA
jgi:hypothetical protein